MGNFFPLLKAYVNLGEVSIILKEVFSCHGLPEEIVLDCGSQSVLLLLLLLPKALDIKNCLSTDFHPQSDSQTKRID